MKRRAAEPSTEAEESGGGTDPKGCEPRPKESVGNEALRSEAERKRKSAAGRVEATVRRKLEEGKGRNRDQVAES